MRQQMNLYSHSNKKNMNKTISSALAYIIIAFLVNPFALQAQQTKWMEVGALQNFYVDLGNEIEIARGLGQQDGFRYPAIYPRLDMQAAKGFWMGARNVVDEGGNQYPVRVIHVGPRVSGQGYFFPTEFKTTAKFPSPEANVEGALSYLEDPGVDEVDPTMGPDKIINNVVNTALGITMQRRIIAFANEHHENYHIIEYTFTNTGNTDADPDIELPDNTVEDFMVYNQRRWSVNASTRYTIGNPTGWGMNTMNDRVGDGIGPNYGFDDIVANYSWHGYFPQFTQYDNVGGPIWQPSATEISNGGLTPADTTGRLAAWQFVGTVKIHADTSPDDETDDPNQPVTMNHIGSDDPLTSGNDPFNSAKMAQEYDLMTQGRIARHAYIVEPTGQAGFEEPSGDPGLGTSGGFSSGMGFGPWTLAPGDDIKIVVAEAAGGIGYEKGIEVGQAYKNDDIDAKEKNQEFFKGRDVLFETFRRAKAAYQNGLEVPEPPQPPSVFNVNGGGDGIYMDWVYEGDASKIDGFEIYRAGQRRDSTYTLVGTVGPDAREYVDDDSNPVGGPIRGLDYYYYIQAVGKAGDNDGSAMTPAGALKSNRYYTQTYDPARLKRPQGESEDAIRIVPNPYIRNASDALSFEQSGQDRIAFFDIPGKCTITIYTELGEKVKTIIHSDGSGDDYWDLFTDERQKITSGVYIAVIENTGNDERAGEKTIKKFVVIL